LFRLKLSSITLDLYLNDFTDPQNGKNEVNIHGHSILAPLTEYIVPTLNKSIFLVIDNISSQMYSNSSN